MTGQFIEKQNITAIGSYLIGGVKTVSTASVEIKVNPMGTLLDFKVSPEVILIEISKSKRPTYEADFEKYIGHIGQTDSIKVTIEDPKIASYTSSTNYFNGLSVGSTYATITYKGKSSIIGIEVIEYKEPIADYPTGMIDSGKNNTKQFDIKVYPNPIDIDFTIEMQGNTEEISFEIINSFGQVVYNGTFTEFTTVKTNEFAPGLYLIKFISGDNIESIKIIKK